MAKKAGALLAASPAAAAPSGTAVAPLAQSLLERRDERPEWRMVALDTIEHRPDQLRVDVPDETIQELAASVDAVGLLQPLLVRTHPEYPERYQLVTGELRLAAMTWLGWTRVPVIVREGTDEQAIGLQLTENLQRVRPNPMATARGFARLRALRAEATGVPPEAIAAADLGAPFGLGERITQYYLGLVALPPDVQRQIEAGSLTFSRVRPLLSLASPEARRELAELAEQEDLRRHEVEATVRLVRQHVPPQEAVARVVALRQTDEPVSTDDTPATIEADARVLAVSEAFDVQRASEESWRARQGQEGTVSWPGGPPPSDALDATEVTWGDATPPTTPPSAPAPAPTTRLRGQVEPLPLLKVPVGRPRADGDVVQDFRGASTLDTVRVIVRQLRELPLPTSRPLRLELIGLLDDVLHEVETIKLRATQLTEMRSVAVS